MIFIYTTCQNPTEARKIGKMIIEKKLAACVNVWPIESIYFFGGEVKEDDESVLLIKTIEAKVQEIEDLISANHSYDIPCIAVINIQRINRLYKEWMAQCIQ